MGITKNFVVSAEAIRWVVMEDLTPLIAGKRFETPDHFYDHTLLVFLNGVRVERTNDDGYNVLSSNVFEMKETYPTYFRISCGYVMKEI